MTHDIFLSYKREDEPQALRLKRAFEKHGFSVWWDRELPNAEDWRVNTTAALESARCVVVVWTNASVTHTEGFVMDEAQRGRARGVLVPVALDSVEPPLGFGQLQTIDLSHWRGSSKDPFFLDLVAAVHAKVGGEPSPPAKGPARQLMRRFIYGGVASAIGAAALGFGFDVLGVQDHACTIELLQPSLSDFCGAVGIGERPTREERLAFEKLPPGDCAALQDFRERFETSPLRALADSRLADKRVVRMETWAPEQRELVLSVIQGAVGARDEATAKNAALARGSPEAERLCKGFAATTIYRLRASAPRAETWDCARKDSGHACGFSGWAVCDVDVRRETETTTCGGALQHEQ